MTGDCGERRCFLFGGNLTSPGATLRFAGRLTRFDANFFLGLPPEPGPAPLALDPVAKYL